MSIETRVAVPTCITPFRIARKGEGYYALWTHKTERASMLTPVASPTFASPDRVRSYMANVYADIREVKA
jgi:hypothetical protein